MGGNSTKTVAQQLKIIDEEWEYITISHSHQIVKNKQNGVQGEVLLIAADPLYTIEDQLDIYNFRKHQEKALVEVYCAEYLKSTNATMCGNRLNIKVIHERIPYRLKDLSILTFPQGIYVLSEALRGFQECYEKVGSFEVIDRMIGVNVKGIVKVWLNEDYAQNHPTSQRPSLQIIVSATHKNSASKQQAFFVRNIVEIVRSMMQNSKFPAQFERALKDASGFVQTYCQIQKYCESNKVWVPDRIVLSQNEVNEKRTGNNFQKTALKTKNIVNQSRATYIPYQYPHLASSRDTYVTPNYETRPEVYTYTPNAKKTQTMFRSAQRPSYPYNPQQIDFKSAFPTNHPQAFTRSDFTYKPI